MSTDDLALLFELFETTPRQGPGSAESTRRALRMLPADLRIERVLDLGCGTGASTLVLAEETNAAITAVDIHPPFLATLRDLAAERGVADRITTVAADMAATPFLGTGFDLVWAEGSAYSIGFENALRRWHALLRPRGCLVVTELVWFTATPSDRARAFLTSEYPAVRDETTRIDQARRLGYEPVGSFRLPLDDWRAYYSGLDAPLRAAIARHGALDVYEDLRTEMATHAACGEEYGYACLVLRVG